MTLESLLESLSDCDLSDNDTMRDILQLIQPYVSAGLIDVLDSDDEALDIAGWEAYTLVENGTPLEPTNPSEVSANAHTILHYKALMNAPLWTVKVMDQEGNTSVVRKSYDWNCIVLTNRRVAMNRRFGRF